MPETVERPSSATSSGSRGPAATGGPHFTSAAAVPALPEVVYTPASEWTRPGQLLRGLARDLWVGRELAWRLFLRNLRARYRQTMFGYVWAVMPPIALTLLWALLKGKRVVTFDLGEGIPFAAYALTGFTLWFAFLGALKCPMKAMKNSRAMLEKLNFPREALLVTHLGEVLFDFGMGLLVLGAFLAFSGVRLTPLALLFPLGAMLTVLFGFGLGVVLTPLDMLYKDVTKAIEAFSTMWMFSTPLFYPPMTGTAGALVNWVNPAVPLVVTTRSWLLGGQPEPMHLAGFAVYSLLGLMMLLIGVVGLRLAIPYLVERM